MTAMSITLTRVGDARFEARSPDGNVVFVDGPEYLGGRGEGMRPMEMFLVALASCSAIDVIHILQHKQRQPLAELVVHVRGTRADAVPAVFTKIELTFEATGAVNEKKLRRAVALSVEKYCSVATMLQSNVVIEHVVVLRGTALP